MKKMISGLLCLALVLQPVLPALADDFLTEEGSAAKGAILSEEGLSEEAYFSDTYQETDPQAAGAGEQGLIEEVPLIEEEHTADAGYGVPVASLDEILSEEAPSEAESMPDGETVPETEPLPGAETGSETASMPGGVTEPLPGGETEPDTEPLSDGETEAETEPLLEEETESETDGLFEDEGQGDEEVAVEIEYMEEQDPTVVSGRLYDGPMMISLEQYDGCFGNQLSGNARMIYDERVSWYAKGKKTGTMTLGTTKGREWEKNNSPYTFKAELIKDENGALKINTKAEEYLACKAKLDADMQASVDAFLYDHPEVFWLRGGKYSSQIKATQNGEGYVSKIEYTPGVAFPGAETLVAQFDSAVARKAAELQASADTNHDGKVQNVELIRAIHDYLCERLWYDTESYSDYQTTKDYRIFCAAGGVLDSVGTGVVCEGYAKPFKVLCDKLRIPCVLIGGTVTQGGKSEGHMWNGVQVDGRWYLLDATWDDHRDEDDPGFTYNYFLVGNTFTNRKSSGNFSGSKNTTVFVYPELSLVPKVRFDGDHIYCVETLKIKEPTCTLEGEATYHCIHCGEDIVIPFAALGHNYGDIETFPPTCTKNGYTQRVCERCGSIDIQDDAAYPALGHAWTEVVTKPTHTTAGYTTHTCSRCGESYRDQETVPVKDHLYEDGICIYCGKGDALERASITGIADIAYTGKKVTQKVTVSFGINVLRSGTDYKVTYSDNKKVGTAKVTIRGIGRYQDSKPVTRTFKIKKKSVSALEYSPVKDYTYTGRAFTPSVTVKNGTVKLKKDTDYTVTYASNTKIGTATITVKGKGSYTGSKKIKFQILPRQTALRTLTSRAAKAMTLTWSRVSGVSGYQIEYAKNKNFKNSKKVTAGAGATSRTISKLTGGSTYYVRIRTYKKVGSKKYYSAWSGVLKGKARKK